MIPRRWTKNDTCILKNWKYRLNRGRVKLCWCWISFLYSYVNGTWIFNKPLPLYEYTIDIHTYTYTNLHFSVTRFFFLFQILLLLHIVIELVWVAVEFIRFTDLSSFNQEYCVRLPSPLLFLSVTKIGKTDFLKNELAGYTTNSQTKFMIIHFWSATYKWVC